MEPIDGLTSASLDTVDHIVLNIFQPVSRPTLAGSSYPSINLSCAQRIGIGGSLIALVTILCSPPGLHLGSTFLPDASSNAGFDSMAYADNNIGLRVGPAVL